MDFRNAIKWYQYDPTKWFISAMRLLGLASLKVFPDNEVRKGQLTMSSRSCARLRNSSLGHRIATSCLSFGGRAVCLFFTLGFVLGQGLTDVSL